MKEEEEELKLYKKLEPQLIAETKQAEIFIKTGETSGSDVETFLAGLRGLNSIGNPNQRRAATAWFFRLMQEVQLGVAIGELALNYYHEHQQQEILSQYGPGGKKIPEC